MSLVKKITDWMLEKEEAMAKKGSIPMEELEHQIAKVEEEKQKIQAKFDEAMQELNHVSTKLEEFKKIELDRYTEK